MKKLLTLALVAVTTYAAEAAETVAGKSTTPVNDLESLGAVLLGMAFAFIVWKLGQDTQDGARYDIMFGYAEEHPTGMDEVDVEEEELQRKLNTSNLI